MTNLHEFVTRIKNLCHFTVPTGFSRQLITLKISYLQMTSFPPLSSTICGMRHAGLTLRLDPSTMQRSAFLDCSMAAVSSLSGRFSPKLMMES